jgi:glycosyltransferase involved in cell wall biosynthesis
MRIGLNLLHTHPGIGWGAWNYIEGLVQALGVYDEANNYIVYCTSLSEVLVPRTPNFQLERIEINGENRIQRIFHENTFLQWRASRDKLDCMHWFANTQAIFATVPGVVTVYDLRMFDDPKDYPLAYRAYLRTMIPLGVRKAAVVAPMSQVTANDLTRILGTKPDRMIVIPTPIGPRFRPTSAAEVTGVRVKYRLPDQFWLYVARFSTNKNHERLLQAYARLKRQQLGTWPLVLRADMYDREQLFDRLLAENGLRDDVVLLPKIDAADMPALFTAATALVFPSLYEGGGIPVMEAMACGLPVVASNIPTTREFAGEAALIFDPTDVETMADAMARMAKSPELRAEYRARGLKKAEEFAPEKIAAGLVRAYECAAGGRKE